MVDKITPTDPRVQFKTANLNGVTYGYILAEPEGKAVDTIFLIHGWPDLALGWRYQIPLLLSLNLRVVVPNMMGYAGTDAPDSPTYYTFKRASDDIAALASHLSLSSIILGGHDWGGAVVFRIALHHPSLIRAIFTICTPFTPPRSTYTPATVLPNFKYQLHLASGEVEQVITGPAKIREFLNGMYGGRTANKKPMFSVSHGVHFENLEGIGPSPLLEKEEMDYYVEAYSRNGLHGPLNWYRTGELNFEDEKGLVAFWDEGGKLEIPVLYVAGTRDSALPPSLGKGMGRYCAELRKAEVEAGHWALWEKPGEVNALVGEWLRDVVLVGKEAKSSL
ncbi:epoxide hydrolase [Hyaloscypha variabilis]